MDHTIRCMARAAVAMLLGLALVGCSSAPAPTSKVSGKVTDSSGAPLKGGSIGFSGIGKSYGPSGQIKEDGTYILSTFDEGDGAPAGDYNVNITDGEGKPRTISSGNPATVKTSATTLDFKVD